MPINSEHFSCISLQIRTFFCIPQYSHQNQDIFMYIFLPSRSQTPFRFYQWSHEVFYCRRIQFRITCGLYLVHLFNFETGTVTQSFSEFVTLILLKITGQLFCTMSFYLGLLIYPHNQIVIHLQQKHHRSDDVFYVLSGRQGFDLSH